MEFIGEFLLDLQHKFILITAENIVFTTKISPYLQYKFIIFKALISQNFYLNFHGIYSVILTKFTHNLVWNFYGIYSGIFIRFIKIILFHFQMQFH